MSKHRAPYRCLYCPRTFFQRDGCELHMKARHGRFQYVRTDDEQARVKMQKYHQDKVAVTSDNGVKNG